jgi:hypothetical protein
MWMSMILNVKGNICLYPEHSVTLCHTETRMAKKIISILLVFSVNILLLAHAVLPHHHHDGIPHFAFSLTEEDHQHTKDSCCCSHEEAEEDFCMFDQAVDVVLKSKDHSLCNLSCSEHPDSSGSLLTAILLSYTYDVSSCRQETPLISPPYLISYSFDPVSSTGLRAPPIERG